MNKRLIRKQILKKINISIKEKEYLDTSDVIVS